MDLWRLTSDILMMSAPASAALIRNPARQEWPLKIAASSPAAAARFFSALHVAIVAKRVAGQIAALIHSTEHKAGADLCTRQPHLHEFDRRRWYPLGTAISWPSLA